MFDERVGVAVKRNGRISVPEYFGQRSHVHSAFERAGRKRVAQRVKAAMTDIQFFKHQFETPLVRAHRNDVAVCRHHEVRIAAFLYILQILYQLSGNRYFAAGSRGFGIVEYDSAACVVTRPIDRNQSFFQIDVLPSERDEFAHAQSRIKTQHDPEHLLLFTRRHSRFYFLLFGERETIDYPFVAFRAFYAVCRIFSGYTDKARRPQRIANNGYNHVYGVCRQSPARLFVAAA